MNLVEVKEGLKVGFGGALEEAASLAAHTTFRIGGPAGILVRPREAGDLFRLLEVVAAAGADLLVLGRGSNVLISDHGFGGVAAVLSGGMRRMTKESEYEVYVESGCDLKALVKWTIAAGMAGLEDLAGIPGSVGGAVRMNAGAMGSEIGQRVKDIEVVRLSKGKVETELIEQETIGFDYRSTDLDEGDIIYGIRLTLAEGDRETLESRRGEVMKWRRENQPLEQPSAGSVFRNPPGISAGEIIERCGCKGMRVGGAMVSEKHANFIVNLGGASADDVYTLMMRIKAAVDRIEGIELEEEIKLVGKMGEDRR
ncbi:MAG: UDP-N-acetylmuramate dehydrogenase [Actinobacteria bacterium]|nr:UDP-N-acetylmuramate dehydrogenase [Actinomycetota bacterium]